MIGFNGITVGIIIILLGLFGVLTKRNTIKIIMCLYVMNSGVILFFVSLGYVVSGQAAIFDHGRTLLPMVDPLPQAVMLTSIVIGLVITSLALALALKIYEEYKTLDVKDLINKQND
ncbi:hypothetical protein A2291_02890 [candidate division WOR-1 bacterium RIFOXYB2_FULL_42_35]|uniref:Cation:proton antiporter n=1 Tax=candidate division WOR-1 bacterium RIFOXYC2_FULL_41_25 TaxID=1802586 RepID=A0A1F4TR75_UNCSA|nr:MAG: hypothetical protein A2247_01200 [candidate division WOR-1 bacterium RIFOXYA2_FULL_41_14]OGC25697.1 MAG: hypothetical protein A2291_02890 [candidate division WOR-1 bacterium RIFOXYB2_FULL_42_35]OGC35099.1 MAG: hypothetical protein A2462_06035 [candidate division WOR-1 bacterium RIFOXYC2_FULL_41_25]OGC43965.1 MAG: hypothetical protein A2548_05460 [candidate division WOR-1 bacterium RIFOXYD2_FULL_41_8]